MKGTTLVLVLICAGLSSGVPQKGQHHPIAEKKAAPTVAGRQKQPAKRESCDDKVALAKECAQTLRKSHAFLHKLQRRAIDTSTIAHGGTPAKGKAATMLGENKSLLKKLGESTTKRPEYCVRTNAALNSCHAQLFKVNAFLHRIGQGPPGVATENKPPPQKNTAKKDTKTAKDEKKPKVDKNQKTQKKKENVSDSAKKTHEKKGNVSDSAKKAVAKPSKAEIPARRKGDAEKKRREEAARAKKKAKAEMQAATKVNATAAKTEDVLERVTDTLNSRPVGIGKDATAIDIDVEQARQVYHNGDQNIVNQMKNEVKVRRDIAAEVDAAAETAHKNDVIAVKEEKRTPWNQMSIVDSIVRTDPAATRAEVKTEKLRDVAAEKADAEARKVEEKVRAQLMGTGAVARVERRLDGDSGAA